MTDYRQTFLDEIEFFTERRAAILDMMQKEPEGEIFWGLLLRMTEADITRNRKGIDSIDGKTSHLDFMRWYREYLFLKQVRLAELRGIVESGRDNGCFNTPIGRALHEAALQAVRDDLLQETHHREQLDAAMEEVDAMHPVSEPDSAGEKVEYYGRFPIRCGRFPNGDFTLNANDTVAVLRVINGEIDSMADQPHLNAEEVSGEMNRVAMQYQFTPETQHFRQWLGVNL